MKRIMGMIALVAVLMVPTASFAASDQLGIYVAPKFIYSVNQMNGLKEIWTEDDWFNSEGFTSGSEKFGNKSDNTFGGSIAIGYDFDKRFDVPIRTEIEYAFFSQAEIKHDGFMDPGVEYGRVKHQYDIQTLFWNTYFDINTGTKFTPYIGAGIGLAFIDYRYDVHYIALGSETANQSPATSKMNTNFAWNIGAGVGYDITDNWTIDAGYRFVSFGSVSTKTKYDGDEKADWSYKGKTDNLYQHQFAVGVRYTF